jgi:hypothetical protein
MDIPGVDFVRTHCFEVSPSFFVILLHSGNNQRHTSEYLWLKEVILR